MKRLMLAMLLASTLSAQSSGHWIVLSHGIVGWHATVSQAADPFQEQINVYQQRFDEEIALYHALIEVREQCPTCFDEVFNRYGLVLSIPATPEVKQ